MGSMVDVILEYKLIVGLVILVVFALLCLISESLRGQAKKVLIFLLVVSGLGLGYYLLTGKSPSAIPRDISRYFSDPHIQDEPTHRYHRDPEENYGEQINQ